MWSLVAIIPGAVLLFSVLEYPGWHSFPEASLICLLTHWDIWSPCYNFLLIHETTRWLCSESALGHRWFYVQALTANRLNGNPIVFCHCLWNTYRKKFFLSLWNALLLKAYSILKYYIIKEKVKYKGNQIYYFLTKLLPLWIDNVILSVYPISWISLLWCEASCEVPFKLGSPVPVRAVPEKQFKGFWKCKQKWLECLRISASSSQCKSFS